MGINPKIGFGVNQSHFHLWWCHAPKGGAWELKDKLPTFQGGETTHK
jgi:hypothetical protein